MACLYSRLLLIILFSFCFVFPCVAWGDLQEKTLSVGDESRQYLVYRPDNLAVNAPLVLVFHGYTGTARQIMAYSGMNEQADKHGFVVAYPQGSTDSEGNPFFNVGYLFHRQNRTDDILFVRLLIAELLQSSDLDPSAVYATGMSNGGDMSYLLACRASDLIAAIAPVAGTMMNDWDGYCKPEGSLPVLAVHGTHDDITWFDGDSKNEGGWGEYRSQEDIIDFWVKHNELDRSSSTILVDLDPRDDSRVRLESYWSTSQLARVQFYIVENGGHDWPGMRYDWWNPLYYLARYQMGFGKTRDIVRSELIGNFFASVRESGGEPGSGRMATTN